MFDSTFVCPHCQKSVEPNRAEAAHSLHCPLCGKVILHQPAEAVVPQVLAGDIRRRMMHDPEVKVRVKALKWGSGIFVGIIVFTVLASYLNLWSLVDEKFFGGANKHNAVAGGDAITLPATHQGEPLKKSTPETTPKILTAQESHAPWRTTEKKEEPQPAAPLTDEARAMQTAALFLNAPNVDERLKLVRDLRVMEPKIRDYYKKHPDGAIGFERIDPQEKNPLGESTFAFSVLMPKGERRRMIVGLSKSGDFKVDWASFVLFAEMDWSEFIAQKPEVPVCFRVLAVQDERFQNGFADSKGLLCLRLVDPRAPQAPALWGYASRTSNLGRSLEFLLKNSSGESLPLMLGLKYESLSAANDQVWISELVAQGWVAQGK